MASNGDNIRVISSPTTFLTKFILPVFMIVVFGGLTVMLFSEDFTNNPQMRILRWVFGSAWLLAALFAAVWGSKLKKVSIRDNRTMLISNFRDEIEVSPLEIKQIIEHRWQRGNPITIEFRSPTKFGNSISFLPGNVWRWKFWTEHPIAHELQDLAIRAREKL